MNPVSEVTKLRRDVFTRVAQWALENPFQEKPSDTDITTIAKEIIPNGPPRYRCCIHKERAITEERIRIMTESLAKPLIKVITEACNGCSLNKYTITDACQNCVAHPCRNSCPKKAISVIQNRAFIDQTVCVECGKCAKACPYHAILEISRPCERACIVKAVLIGESRKAAIDENKCVSCGKCVTICPFGAITDTSQMVNVIQSLSRKEVPQIALVAPSLAGQFGPKVSVGHVKSALLRLGFDQVVEVALGADMVAQQEAAELRDHYDQKLMTNSCCPAHAQAVKQKLPELAGHISTTLSPMRVTGQLVKKQYNNKVNTVFIGPCMAKKVEATNGPEIDLVLTFEELGAIFQAAHIDLASQIPTEIKDASRFGRLFAKAGGVSQAVARQITDLSLNIIPVQGLAQCLATLKTAAKEMNSKDFTFVEGMACEGGCIGGPGTMATPTVATRAVEKYAGDSAKSEKENDKITA